MKKLMFLLPLLTVSLAPSLRADAVVVFNEIMYHPATNESALEWVELRNQLAVDVDISGWSITGGIGYTFASNTIVRGRGYLLVAVSPTALTSATGITNVVGPFIGRLGNNGDTLELRNNSGRLMDEVNYETDDDWPVAPDGAGVSLAKRDPETASGPVKNWAASEQIGGTPGRANFLTGTPPDTRHITIDAAWKYETSGVDLGTIWRTPGYDDNGWASRAAFTNRSIPTLFNTGIGTNGVALGAGVADPHYSLTAAAQGAVPTNALAMANNTAWLANDASSVWIGVNNSGANNVNSGAYHYRTGFSLDGFLPSTVQINVAVAIDNDLTNVFLNGVPTGLAVSGFAGFSAPLPLAGFVSGTNTLEFRTINAGTTANPHGFRAAFTSSGLAVNTNTPLPTSPVTHYFRKSFTFSGSPAFTQLRINPVLTDGAIVYLNGVEVYRQNMPEGAVGFSTPALSDVASPAYSGPITIPVANLIAGLNVLAVELHRAADSTDAPLFGCDLISTPLPEPPVTLSFYEVSAPTNSPFFIELFNYGEAAIPLADFVLLHDGATDHSFAFAPGNVNQGGVVAVTALQLGFTPAVGDKFYLRQVSSGRIIDAVAVASRTKARFPQADSPWAYPAVPTPGGANSVVFRNEIVINEIMYHHALLPGTNNAAPRESPEAWIELYNRGASPIDLGGWQLGGGISYLFTAGQTIPAGGYLVVADDVPYMRALHPDIQIVGDFGGRLSGRTDRIVLRDPSGNIADEVRYFDGGRWPGYADGGGSSLELRDPNADNSKAEAWAASDESDGTAWQNYSYRMVAAPSVTPSPDGQWREFVFGLLGDGEFLIDDLRVVHSPTNNPIQYIANGDFENGITGWRVLGNHGRSRVITDPENAGNHVLHVVATGPQEHMHNHIETTLAGGRSVVNGQLYEISYRAKHIGGNNLLNTRLYFNRVARTTALPLATLNGTPGAVNSRRIANIGPTFSQFGHTRVVPAASEPVTVSVVAEDPQGVASCDVFWSVNSGAFVSAPMTHHGGGRYTGTIPGQTAAATVQFYVRATDGLGAAATFPAEGADSGALYKVNDGAANLAIAHNIRLILTPANTALLHASTNVMSNDLLPCTVIYNEERAYYDAALHLKSSQRGRDNPLRVSYHVEFPPDDLFRGVHSVMLIDRSGGGSSPPNEEILIRHMLNRAGGVPAVYADLCRVLAPQAAQNGGAILAPRFEDEFIDTAFENGGDGTLFELELIYYATQANADGYKLPVNDAVQGLDIKDVGHDKETYRYNFIIKNHRAADDYSRWITFAKSWSFTGAALENFARETTDIDQLMRAYALVSLCGVDDMYTFGNNHNWMMYIPPDNGRVVYLPWDMDFSFTAGLVTGPLVGNRPADANLTKLISTVPANLRTFYAHVLDHLDTVYNPSYMAHWANSYGAYVGQNYSGRLTYIQQRSDFARTQINSANGNAPFAVNGTNFITTSNNLVILTGTAPVGVKTIKVNGVEYPIVWTSVSAWRLVIPVTEETNVLNLVGFNLKGNPIPNFSRTITVNYTGPKPDPTGNIVINEIMYNPAVPGAAFIELANLSTNQSYALSGWRVNGLDYTFPDGSVITNRQFLVLAGSVVDYVAAYGTNAPVPMDQFSGNLQNDGETLTLLRPGPAPGTEIVVDQVRYESVPPWPALPNGQGPSLQLIDATQDNSRPGNWSDGTGWRQYTFTGSMGANATNLSFFLAAAGEVYIDKMSIVEGTVAEQGTNLLPDPSFESGVFSPWVSRGNHSNSTVTSAVALDGSYSLRLTGTGVGGPNNLVDRALNQLTASVVHTFSFWYLPSTNGTGLNYRITSNYRNIAVIDYRPIFATPGLTNTARGVLPPFPQIWLNELQPVNLTGIPDNQGEREPWIELYNAGTTPVSLAGYSLANNYSNIAPWPFPASATIQPGEFKIVFADGEANETTANEWHTSFHLNATGGSVALSWTPSGTSRLLDYLNYTNIPPGRSYGDFPDGQPFDRREFYVVTPAAANNNQAPPIVVYINEWMAANTSGLLNTNNGNRFDDWIELYNPGNTPANLAGYFLTDNLANKRQFEIPAGYVIPPQGFLLVWADGEARLNTNTDPALHVSFRLSQDGEAIGLFAGDGTTIDSVDFRTEPQFNNISQGRFPDGPNATYYLAAPTPLALNTTWANRYPALAPIPDAELVTGDSLIFTAVGSDPDSNSLTYSLAAGAPTNAMINPTNGMFSWTPTAAQTPGTNVITVRVTDNGVPPLSTPRTFTVIVKAGFRVTSIVQQPNGDISFTIGATVGKTYRVEYKDSLGDPEWTQLGNDHVATSNALPINDSITNHPQRFYRVLQLD